MIVNTKDVLTGALFLGIAIAFGWGATRHEVGTGLEMGPGYFPLMLAVVLGVIGLFIAARGLRTRGTPIGALGARGVILITLTPILFGLTVGGLGLVPSLALVIFLAAYASRSMTFLRASLLTLGLTAFCVLVFSYAVGLRIPLFGPWLA